MSLKEELYTRREEYWKKEDNRIRDIISRMLFKYQEEELFASDVYKLSIVAKLFKDEATYTIQIFAIVDRDVSDSESLYVTHCVKDYAIEDYVSLFDSMFEDMGIIVTNIDSDFPIKDMKNGEEKVIIEGNVQLFNQANV